MVGCMYTEKAEHRYKGVHEENGSVQSGLLLKFRKKLVVAQTKNKGINRREMSTLDIRV